MRRIGTVAGIVGILLALAGPATAVTVGPDDPAVGGTIFDFTGSAHGPIGSDDRWDAEVTLNGKYFCSMFGADPSCWSDQTLAVGARYDAVVDETGGGYWWCSIYNSDGCTWQDPYEYKQEYVFTYTGKGQTLARYFAPVSIGIAKKKARHPHRWNVSCNVTRAGAPLAGKAVFVQWRDRRHPRWHDFDGTWKTNRYGKAGGWVQWAGIPGSLRCFTADDWHTRAGASRPIRMRTR